MLKDITRSLELFRWLRLELIDKIEYEVTSVNILASFDFYHLLNILVSRMCLCLTSKFKVDVSRHMI